MKILHIVMMKLIFNMQYFNFDDMVCSDRSFFRLNTKMANSYRFPSGPGARGYTTSFLMMMDDFDLHFPPDQHSGHDGNYKLRQLCCKI